METKSVKRQYKPLSIKDKEYPDFIVPVESPKIIDLLAATDYLSPDLSDKAILRGSIVKLFMEAFALDIRTCTEGEWAERITIQGGTLKQWQTFINVTKTKKMSSKKAVSVFIALSAVLLIGIGLLPKSPQVFVPTSITTSITASADQPRGDSYGLHGLSGGSAE